MLIKYYKDSLKLDAFGMLMYNAVLSSPILLMISWICGDFQAIVHYDGAASMPFWFEFNLIASLHCQYLPQLGLCFFARARWGSLSIGLFF